MCHLQRCYLTSIFPICIPLSQFSSLIALRLQDALWIRMKKVYKLLSLEMVWVFPYLSYLCKSVVGSLYYIEINSFYFWSPAFNPEIMPDFDISCCLNLLRWIFYFCPWVHLCDGVYLFICVFWNVPAPLEWSQAYHWESFFCYVFEFCLQVIFDNLCIYVPQRDWYIALFYSMFLCGFKIVFITWVWYYCFTIVVQ